MTVNAAAVRSNPRLQFIRRCIEYVENTPKRLFAKRLGTVVDAIVCQTRIIDKKRVRVRNYSYDNYEKHVRSRGKAWHECGTKGCLLGILITMPEVHEELDRNPPPSISKFVTLDEVSRRYHDLSKTVFNKLGESEGALWNKLFIPTTKKEEAKGHDERTQCVKRLSKYYSQVKRDIVFEADINAHV